MINGVAHGKAVFASAIGQHVVRFVPAIGVGGKFFQPRLAGEAVFDMLSCRAQFVAVIVGAEKLPQAVVRTGCRGLGHGANESSFERPRPNGPAIRPAQGNALGTIDNRPNTKQAQRAGHSIVAVSSV
ncbi:MAG: hypothetical protein R3C19_14620 [Planctomycetaceae bacterium]